MRIEVTDNAGEQLVFDWNPETGEVAGPDGWWVDHALALWKGVGELGAAEALPDPRRSAAGLASFLTAQGFDLPEELREGVPGG